MGIELAPVLFAIIYTAVSIYAQIHLSELIFFINNNQDIRKKTGEISDLYFIFSLPRLNYRFALYLLRNKRPNEKLKKRFPEYGKLRAIAITAFALHIVMGISIGIVMLIHA